MKLSSTSKNLLKNRNWPFSLVPCFTWKSQFVSNILWVIVNLMKLSFSCFDFCVHSQLFFHVFDLLVALLHYLVVNLFCLFIFGVMFAYLYILNGFACIPSGSNTFKYWVGVQQGQSNIKGEGTSSALVDYPSSDGLSIKIP